MIPFPIKIFNPVNYKYLKEDEETKASNQIHDWANQVLMSSLYYKGRQLRHYKTVVACVRRPMALHYRRGEVMLHVVPFVRGSRDGIAEKEIWIDREVS